MALAGLVIGATAPVLLVGWITVRDVTSRSLRDRAEIVLDGVTDSIAAQVAAAADLGRYTARAVADGRLDVDDVALCGAFMRGSLAAAPQIFGLSLVHPDGRMTRWIRESGEERIEASEQLPFAAAGQGDLPPVAGWLDPFVSSLLREPVLAWREALRRPDGNLAGTLVVVVTTGGLSRYLSALGADVGVTPFVLLGREAVLAHPALAAMPPAGRLPGIEAIGDAALAAIWRDPHKLPAAATLRGAQAHWSPIPGGATTVFFYREVEGYGAEPLIVGFHVPSAETRRMRWVGWALLAVSLALLALAVWIAARLGRAIARPITVLAAAAEDLEASRFDDARARLLPQQEGRVVEMATAAGALARAAAALRLFESYVPRTLVRRLRRSQPDAARPREAELTLLFLDLEGYSAFAAGCGAEEASAYVNEVLGIAGPAIEAAGGTIDKFTGDGLLAFWGAPVARDDDAAAALRATAELIAPLEAAHAARQAAGLPACRVRLGLHTGRVIVGDIGYPGRVNYTAIGGAVNTAARVQAALRGMVPERAAVLAVTAATLRAAGVGDRWETHPIAADASLGPVFRIVGPRG